MRIELVTDLSRLNVFAKGWDALADSLGEPRAGVGLVMAWARHMIDAGSQLRIWIAVEGTRVIGVLPLSAESMPRGRERLLPPASTLMLGIIPIALIEREEEIAVSLASALADSTASVDLVGLYWIPAKSSWIGALTSSLPSPEWEALEPTLHTSSYADLAGGGEGWLARRQPKFRREGRRCARRLTEEGFHLFSTTEPAEMITRLPSLQALYRARQLARGGGGYRFDETMIMAITEAIAESPPGQYRLVTVESDDAVIAAQLSLRRARRVSAWIIGFDATWTRFGPGIAALTRAIVSSADAGARIFDLGEGAQTYKGDLTDGENSLESRLWCRPRMARLFRDQVST